MTIEVNAQEQIESTTTAKDLSSPDLSYAEYEALRRGHKLPESKSAPAPEVEKEQKDSEESDPSEKEAKGETEAKEDSDEESDEAEESKEDKPKKKGGFQRRIDKLNAKMTAAQQEAEYWKQQALKGTAEPKKESKGPAPAAAEGKPKADDFDTHAEYVEALTDWKTEQKLIEREQKAEKSRLESEQEKVLKAHSERVKAFADKVEDFEDVLANLDDVPNSPAVESLILSSENGPELLYELAKDPKEAKRIATLPPLAAARELGKIEAKIVARASEEKKPEPKKLTNAPRPIGPIGGGKAAVAKSITDPNISFAEYERLRREQLKRRRG
jgi:hypothetical protein